MRNIARYTLLLWFPTVNEYMGKHEMREGLQPKCVRQKDAPAYLGTNERNFNRVFRPYLTEIPLGEPGKARGVGYDRNELDSLFDEYKHAFGRPPKKGTDTWVKSEHQVSINGENAGTSIKPFTGFKSADRPKPGTLMKQKKSFEKYPRKLKKVESSASNREEHLMKLYNAI